MTAVATKDTDGHGLRKTRMDTDDMNNVLV